jgi:hypothetical protein
MAAISPTPKLQFFDANGNPLAGGKLYTYAAGTTTPLATYTDAGGLTPNANPVILDSRGEASVWLGTSAYKFRLTTATNVDVWTVDDITTVTLAQFAAANGSSLIGFQQAGALAQPMTVQDALRHSYTFEQFGAVGDNSNDDTAEMQAAIDEVSAIGGGTLLGKPGAEYKISSALTLKTGVQIDLCGATIWQHTNNTQIVTAPTGALIVYWGLRNGYLRYVTPQDGTSTVSVTVTGTLNVGDKFVGLTSGGWGRVVSVSGGLLTYLAGNGALVNGESLSVNSQTQATTTSGPTTSKCGIGLRLANGAFSYLFIVDNIQILDAYDGITCPATTGSFAFVGQISNYTASVARWAINYDCDSNVGANTNVILQNCWHVHSQVPSAPFSSGFRFNACAMFRWDSVLADKIEDQFLFIQTSSGKIGTISLEASNLSAVASLEAAAVQLSDSSVSIETIKYVGNTFRSLNTISVTITGTIAPNNIIVDGTTGASGKVVSVSGSRVTFTQNTLDVDFGNGNNVLVGGVVQGTVAAVPSSSGNLWILRASSATTNNQNSATIENFVTSGNVYEGKDIYDVAPTANNVSPASGPFLIYNTQATLDRTTVGITLTGTIAVGNTITGATSGASGVVTAVGTFRFLYKPNNFNAWIIGENVQVAGVTQGTVLSTPAIPGNLADFATPPSVKTWNGVYRDLVASAEFARIRGNMSETVRARRLLFENSVPNSSSSLGVIPSGTGTSANFAVANANDPDNAAIAVFEVGAATAGINSTKLGTGTTLPLRFSINGNTTLEITTARNVTAGIGTLATTATNGFFYVPNCAGAPTGTPTAISGFIPIVVDSTNHKLYFYSGGSWRDAGP